MSIINIPGTFLQIDMLQDNNKVLIIKILGEMIDILVLIVLEVYEEYIMQNKGSKVLYINLKKVVSILLKALLLFQKKI